MAMIPLATLSRPQKPRAGQPDGHQRKAEELRLAVVGIAPHVSGQIIHLGLQPGSPIFLHMACLVRVRQVQPVLYQRVHRHMEEIGQRDQLAQLRHDATGLPLADRLPGDAQKIRQLFLAQAPSAPELPSVSLKIAWFVHSLSFGSATE